MKNTKIVTFISINIAFFASAIWAQTPLPIFDKAGSHTIDAGAYDATGKSGFIDGYRKNITVDVINGDTVELFNAPSFILESYGNYGSATDGGDVIFNGNLIAHAARSDYVYSPIMTNDGGSKLTINGNLTLDGTNTVNRATWVHSYLVLSENNVTTNLNGNVDLSMTTSNNLGTALGGGAVVFMGDNVLVNLGLDSDSNVHIHDMVSNAAWNAESYGIFGGEGDFTINVNGNLVIENIEANTTSSFSGNYAHAAGIEAQEGTINVLADVTIRHISATGVNAEAYALAAYNNGTVNVNQGTNNIVKVEGILIVANNGTINLNLTNSYSYFKGSMGKFFTGGEINLSLSNGGSWHIVEDSGVNNLVLDGGKLAFYADANDLGNMQKLILSNESNISFVNNSEISVILSNDFTEDEYMILLIDTSFDPEYTINTSFFTADFLDEFGNELENWHLIFVEGEGLYAYYAAIPEPAEAVALLGLIAIGFAAYKRRKNK